MIPTVVTRGPVLAVAWSISLLLVAGCSGAAGSGSVAGGSLTAAGLPPGETGRYEAARREWTASGIRDYDLVVDRRCFCAVTGPVAVVVRGGVAVSTAFYTAAGGPTPSGPPTGLATTVPDLFDTLQTLLAYAEQISVTYGEHGVPTSIVSQGKLNTADDEVSYTVRVTTVAAGESPVAHPSTPASTRSPTAVPTTAPAPVHPTVPVPTPVPRSTSAAGLARRLADARAAWAAAAIRDYDLVVSRACFCEGGDVLVSVRGGRPVKAVLLPGFSSFYPAKAVRADTPRTVEALFAIVAQPRPSTETFVVSFGAYGVPTRIESDPSAAAYDDQTTLRMTFTRVRAGQPPSTALPTTSPPPTGAPSSTVVPSAKPSVQGGPATAAPTTLAQARRVWAATGVRDYSLRITRACFCAYRGTVEVTVRAGRAAGMRMLPMDGGGDPGPIPVDTPATVEALLDLVATEQRTADKVTVGFDRYGVPVRIASDRIAKAVDDEMAYLVTFTPA